MSPFVNMRFLLSSGDDFFRQAVQILRPVCICRGIASSRAHLAALLKVKLQRLLVPDPPSIR